MPPCSSMSAYSGRRSRLPDSRPAWGLDGYIEEMVSGQKVVKVFNHEGGKASACSARRTTPCAGRARARKSYAATMIPAVVTISYVNYALVAVLGGIMALKGMTDVGSLASYLVFVRQAACPSTSSPAKQPALAALAGAAIFQGWRSRGRRGQGTGLTKTRRERAPACAGKTGRWAWQQAEAPLAPARDVRFRDELWL